MFAPADAISNMKKQQFLYKIVPAIHNIANLDRELSAFPLGTGARLLELFRHNVSM